MQCCCNLPCQARNVTGRTASSLLCKNQFNSVSSLSHREKLRLLSPFDCLFLYPFSNILDPHFLRFGGYLFNTCPSTPYLISDLSTTKTLSPPQAMASSLKLWGLLGALIVAGTSAQSLSPVQVLTRDDSTLHIDTAGDADMEEWLAALQRAPALTACPVRCSEASTSGDSWALYPDPASLAACNETMLLDVAFLNEVENDQNSKLAIKACAADFSSKDVSFKAEEDVAALCTTPNHIMLDTSVVLSSSIPGARAEDSFSTQHLLAAGRQVINYLGSKKPSCSRNSMSLGYFQSSIIGVFGGTEVHQHGLTTEVLDKFLAYAQQKSLSKTTIVQLCEGDGRGADYGVGIIAGSAKNFAIVQQTMKTWADGRCVADVKGEKDWMTVTIRVPKAKPSAANSTEIVTSEEAISPAHLFSRGGLAHLGRRAECRTTKVEAGDGCWALADRCQISQDDLKKYNPRADFCNTLVPGEAVCCSTGTLPSTIPPGNSDGTCKIIRVVSQDSCASLASKCGLSGNDFMKVNTKQDLCSSLVVGQPVCCTLGNLPYNPPKPKPDGYCFDYTIQKDDQCSAIAVMNDISQDDLKSFNKETWGWVGCDPLYVGTKICLSKGAPPMPAPVSVS